MYNEVKINMIDDNCDCEYVISEAGTAITPFVYIRMYLGDIDFSAVEIRATYNGGTEWALPEIHGVENLEAGWYMTRLSYSDFSKAGEFELEVRAYYNGEMYGNKALYFFHSNLQSAGEWNLSKQHGVIRDAYNVQQGSTASSGGGGGGTGATYTAGKGIEISDENEIKAKIDNSTIQFNDKGEMEVKVESGLTIDHAVIIKEADSKYLLHEYDEIEYIAGNRIGYAGAENQIIIGGYTAVKSGNQLTAPLYQSAVLFSFSGTTVTEHHITLELVSETSAGAYKFTISDNGKVLGTYTTYDPASMGFAITWSTIYNSATEVAPHGYAYLEFYAVIKPTATATAKSTTWISTISRLNYIFASEPEYNAAVGLTYEPNVLKQVNDGVTGV